VFLQRLTFHQLEHDKQRVSDWFSKEEPGKEEAITGVVCGQIEGRKKGNET
jgi:hypothetical protein